MRILILCTGNSCRSQMAEGFLKSFDPQMEVYSAGTHPARQANPYAVAAMKEVGIDISMNKPKNVDLFVIDPFDYVITVCGGAKEVCPAFTGKVKHRLHIGFDDPADAIGTDEEIMQVYRRVRDEIKEGFQDFYQERIKGSSEMAKWKNSKMWSNFMKDKLKNKGEVSTDGQNDCNCDGGCCPPKKNNIFSKLIFAVIILTAMGIVAVKLIYQQAPAANNQGLNKQRTSVGCDTSSAKTCDTAKGSSCCPNSK
jgi:arsenate reductase (thioredoxin)